MASPSALTPTPNEDTGSANATLTNARHRNIRIVDEEKGHDHEHLDAPPNITSPGGRSGRSGASSLGRLSSIAHRFHLEDNAEELLKFYDRFTRAGKRKIGVMESLKAILLSSPLNVLFVFLPLAWVARFLEWNHRLAFALAFLAIMPLEQLFDFGGEQMQYYLGTDLGDLVVITLNNAVEATLAIILLLKCELTLVKSTIVGVVILHLLLVPGTAFVIGGARIIQQDLHPHLTQLNHSMLTLGVLTLLLPVAFFNSIDTQFTPTAGAEPVSAVTDEVRGKILQLSRGLAILLLIVYICSRVYLHNPPGEDNALDLHNAPNAPEALKTKVDRLRHEDPEVNQYVCIAMLAICIGLMAATAEWLVESIEFVRTDTGISEVWFGLILLPFVSFAANGAVATLYFIRHLLRHYFREPIPPTTLAQAEAIDLSIQFVLFWMPFLVLLGWWTNRPLTLLFDLFEVAVLIGACFLVNYVTADSKTNWAEGTAMVIFYVMIAMCAWFYTGQPEMEFMSQCRSVAEAIAALATGGGDGGHH